MYKYILELVKSKTAIIQHSFTEVKALNLSGQNVFPCDSSNWVKPSPIQDIRSVEAQWVTKTSCWVTTSYICFHVSEA